MKIEEFYKEIKILSKDIDTYQESLSDIHNSNVILKKIVKFNDFYGVSGKSNRDDIIELVSETDKILYQSSINLSFVAEMTERLKNEEEIKQEEIDTLRSIAALADTTRETAEYMKKIVSMTK